MKPELSENDHVVRRREVYLRLGGEDGVDHVASTLYARLVLDSTFGPIYSDAKVDTSRLLRHQRDFISLMLGGPSRYGMDDMREVCQALSEDFDMSGDHCRAMIRHLKEILQGLDVPEDSLEQIVAIAEYVTDTGDNAQAQ